MRDASLLSGTVTVSAVLHVGFAALLLTVSAPRPVEQKPGVETTLSLSTVTVETSFAREEAKQGDVLNTTSANADAVSSRRIPQSTVVARAPDSSKAASLTPGTATTVAIAGNLLTIATNVVEPPQAVLQAPDATQIGSTRLTTPRAPELASTLQSLAATPVDRPERATTARPDPLVLSATGQPSTRLAVLEQPANTRVANTALLPASLPAMAPLGDALMASQTQAAPLAATNTVLPTLSSATPRTDPVKAAPLQSAHAGAAELPSTHATAVLAWSGTLTLDVPESTIDTATALSVPDTGAKGVRDALSASLRDVDCARVQTIYNPATGAIDLRGHVKSDTDRTRLLDRVAAELPPALPLNDRLRQLDAPQCTVLIRLAEMPLPQSVDQFINPLIIGDNLQTRTYSYADGQTMTFDLVGADYDGWLYLDYYDSEGQVLHLLPNEFIDPVLLPARTALVFGDGSAADPARDKFTMRVSPPFGEDIAVAMVANMPLFDAPRPTVEAAGPYLEALAERMRAFRARPNFKGEWVYLFIETRSAE